MWSKSANITPALETSIPSFEITITLRTGSIIRDSSKAEVKETLRS